jgi:integrase
MRENYPGASFYHDRHGRIRWRFRRKGHKDITLPGQPGDREFDEAYERAVSGQPAKKPASITRLGTAAHPRSLQAAWVLVKSSGEWKVLDPSTRMNTTRIVERFLCEPVAEGEAAWGTFPIADLKRRHLKKIIADRADTPHAAKRLLISIRKLIDAAIDEEWIETDPSYKLKWRPAYEGHAAWPLAEIERFDKRWKIGTTPRAVKDLALFAGLRRSDLVRLRKDARTTRVIETPTGSRIVDGFDIVVKKTGKKLFVPIAAPLAESLAALPPHEGETIIVTAFGSPFSEKSITGRMRDWCVAAGLPEGLSLHGLRKTLGDLAAEGGATTRQAMGLLGHDDIAQAELYSKSADQVRLAVAASDAVVTLLTKRR